MMRVWRTLGFNVQPIDRAKQHGNGRQRVALVAAPNRTVACRAMGRVTGSGAVPRGARDDVTETGNEGDIAIAMSAPGQVFVLQYCIDRPFAGEWVRAAVNPDRPWQLVAEVPV